ncbi:mannose-6-phosphate isomerase, type 1 [Filimonas lacunae]|uniref:mannose-6-phosphate isomerase n=1 Tax=Filimonas lacunae TaxID=477680 RepID=A0A173MAL4_9BACT|nr:mannose-6-phosphate isomerase, class I [Filimonas lacunae]BAV04549.1 mannose-6-phosphate isomerase [Filimonas lacunae]SIT31779.1 mannose-6-phosphate isomerase, type 1 [Filimonas lacunae]
MLQDRIYELKGKVQHYAWGGYDYIPHWLQMQNSNPPLPYAEYWMGAHPSAPSLLRANSDVIELNYLIKQLPEVALGKETWNRFGELPYLFKILDVKEMLSIQVHPSKIEAEKGFDAEEAAGIPINAANRNYKDRNHKPEVMVALSEFWLLHGFLQPEALKKVLNSVPAFSSLAPLFEKEGYKALYQHVMELPQQQVNLMLLPLVLAERQKFKAGQLTKHQPGWWVAKLYEGQEFIGDIDRGVFSIYFFNIVEVQPGGAVFQGAGVPHAYLEGQNVELMANSDNVLRGGLTPKHVDVPELLKHTTFEGITPVIMQGDDTGKGERVYNCPVPDFGISKIQLPAGQSLRHISTSLEIIVVIEGTLRLAGRGIVTIGKGGAVAILAAEAYELQALEPVLAYRAFVPRLN